MVMFWWDFCLFYLHLLLACCVLEPMCSEGSGLQKLQLEPPCPAASPGLWDTIRGRSTTQSHWAVSSTKGMVALSTSPHQPLLVWWGMSRDQPRKACMKWRTPGHGQVWEPPRRILKPLGCFTQSLWTPGHHRGRGHVQMYLTRLVSGSKEWLRKCLTLR